jgi:Mg-chelatase subunit ChlD
MLSNHIIFLEVKVMKKNLTELVFIIDRSGSMSDFRHDTIGGINSTIEKQKAVEGEVLVSTVLFNQKSEVVHDRVDMKEIKPMTLDDYRTYGMTALLDAIGDAIHHIGNVHKYARDEDVPEHTIFVITTDGMENSSRRYSSDRVKEMIKRQTEKYGWEFIFLAANIDAIETAGSIGISRERAANVRQSREGYDACYESINSFVSMRRSGNNVGEEWKRRLDDGQDN